VNNPDFANLVGWLPIIWAIVGLPHAGVTACAMKTCSPATTDLASPLTAGNVQLWTKVLRVATWSTAIFLALPSLCFAWTLWQALHWQKTGLLCLMLLGAEIPYMYLLARLRGRAANREVVSLATGLAAGWLALLASWAIFGHLYLPRVDLGWVRLGYWLSFVIIQTAALISAQGIDRELACAGQVRWKLPWRIALPVICFGVFLFNVLYHATAD
jgi:hypothetical protein